MVSKFLVLVSKDDVQYYNHVGFIIKQILK